MKTVIRIFAQTYANIIASSLELLTPDNHLYDVMFEHGAMLNAYCIEFHDIYLE